MLHVKIKINLFHQQREFWYFVESFNEIVILYVVEADYVYTWAG